MGSTAMTLLRSILKMVNSVMAVVGIAMIFYGLWMVRIWQRDMEESSSSSTHPYDSAAPWFIYTFLSIGITLCLITCLGHISAESSNTFCLSCYTVIISIILLIETAVAADILLNSDWEKDLPEDPTERFHDFKNFVNSNFDVFKWIGVLILLAQGLSILLAMALKVLGQNYRSGYDSEDEYLPARLPLIKEQPHSYAVGDPVLAFGDDAWKVMMKAEPNTCR